jgi:hypothetical protein
MYGLKFVLISFGFSFANSNQCTLTGTTSFKPAPLTFCSMFWSDACCDPNTDSQIQGYYEELLDVSSLCSVASSKSRIALRYFFCYGCSPREYISTNPTQNTLYLCPDFANLLDPINFDDCGFNIPGERGNLCAGGSSVRYSYIN